MKRKVVKFFIEFSEYGRLKGKTAKTWGEINKILREASLKISPDLEGYYKTFIHITYDNGFLYKGRMDLVSIAKEEPNLGKEMYDHLMFHSGRADPFWMTKKEYTEYLSNFKKKDIQFAKDFLDNYEIIRSPRK